MYRGGNWNNGSNAGVFYANGNNPRSNYNTNIGFRPASASTVRAQSPRVRATQRSKGCISRCTAPKIDAAGNAVKNLDAPRHTRADYTSSERSKGPEKLPSWQPAADPALKDCHTRAT